MPQRAFRGLFQRRDSPENRLFAGGPTRPIFKTLERILDSGVQGEIRGRRCLNLRSRCNPNIPTSTLPMLLRHSRGLSTRSDLASRLRCLRSYTSQKIYCATYGISPPRGPSCITTRTGQLSIPPHASLLEIFLGSFDRK